MVKPHMPKATAVWLVENTSLTFDQIADFCGLHPLEVQGIADGDVANGVAGVDPVSRDMTTRESIEAAEKDSKAKLEFTDKFVAYVKQEGKRKKSKYTPVARRQDKPDAIAWLVKNHPDMSDAKISKLVGTTKKTILDIREKTYWNMTNLKPRDPVLLGLCTQTALEEAIKSIKPKKDSVTADSKSEKSEEKESQAS